MIRTLLIIAGAGLVLATACIGGAFALGGRDLARNDWNWTIFDSESRDSVTLSHVRGGGTADLGPTITRTLAWSGQTLAVDASLDVEYVQGAQAGVVVRGPQQLAERVRIVDGRIDLTEGGERVVFGWDRNGPTARAQRDELSIVVTAPDVSRFLLNGSGDLRIRDYDQPSLTVGVNGSGEVEATGRTTRLSLDIDGSGEADLANVTAREADVAISGSGEARIHAVDSVRADISGSGDLELTTEPQRVDRDVSGSGDVRIARQSS